MMACLVLTWGCASVIYVSQESGRGQLMKSRDGNPLQPSVLFATAYDDSMPDVSHDNKWVAFKRVVGGFDRIVVRQVDDAAGTTEKNLTQGTRPRWAPAGDWILFRDQGKIYRVKPDGTMRTQITNPGANVTDNFGHDYWDVNTIVFGRGTGTGTGTGQTVGLYLQELNTGAVTGPVLAGCYSPVVSHNGKRMACEVKFATGPALFHYINTYEIPALSLFKRISFTYGPSNPSISNAANFAFSSDDSKFFFSAIPSNGTKRKIYSIEFGGAGLDRLTTNGWDDNHPEGYKSSTW
jgi:hypothetical protein